MKQGWKKRKVTDESSLKENLSCHSCLRNNLSSNEFSKTQLKKHMRKLISSSALKCLNCSKNETQNEVKNSTKDPSLQYIKNPINTPLMKECKNYFTKICKADFRIYIGSFTGWRTVAKLAVRRSNLHFTNLNKDSKICPIMIGLFEPGSHKVIKNTGHSTAHHPSINDVVSIVEEVSCVVPITAYDECSGEGLLRYLLFGVQRAAATVQLTLVVNMSAEQYHNSSCGVGSDDGTMVHTLINALKSVPKADIFHSIWLHFHQASKHNNAICGRDDDSWHLVYGKHAIEETLDISPPSVDTACASPCPRPVLRFPPMVFRQANLDSFTNIIKSIRNWIIPGSSCVELYGGVGTIGLNCLDLLASLDCSDENPYNKSCFDQTLAGLSDPLAGRARYNSSSAAAVATSGALSRCDLILVDPPRKGLDEEVLVALLGLCGRRCSGGSVSGSGASGGGQNKRQKINHHMKFANDYAVDIEKLNAKGSTGFVSTESSSSSPSSKEPKPIRLIYVSCGFKSLMRDANRLLQEAAADNQKDEQLLHHWTLLHAEGHVLFPGADHIETLSVFELQPI